MLARWLIRRVEFSFEGRPWPLIISHRALFICQDLTGIDMLSARLIDPSASLVRALLFAALSCAGANCTIEQVGKAITQSSIDHIREKLSASWSASMADPATEQEKRSEAKDFTWLEAWAIASQEFKLADESWLDMTPRQFRALQNVRLEQLQREELLVGILAASIENFSMCAPKKPVTPGAFMLHKFPEEPERPLGEHIMAEIAKFRG